MWPRRGGRERGLAAADRHGQINRRSIYGIVQSDQASVESAQVQLDYCISVSPIAGRIGLRLVDPGNIVHATDTRAGGDQQVQPIAVVFSLPEEQLPQG